MLATAAPELKLVEQAAELPHCDFHRNWSLGPSLPLPEYAQMRKMARLLAARAVLESEAGHPEAALRTICIGARMARHLDEEPILIAFLVRIAIEALMDRAFQQVVKRYAGRADILKQALMTDREFGDLLDIRNSLRYSVVGCRMMVSAFRANDPKFYDTMPQPPPGISRSLAADCFEARSISFWRRTFPALDRAKDDPMAAYTAMKAINDADDAQATDARGRAKPTHEMDEILCPYFPAVGQKVAEMEARRRLRRTMIALLQYRARTGHLPKSLSQLPAGAPTDPFTSKPLHYRPGKDGFVLYSVGKDLQDDGGNAKPRKKGEAPPDSVITFP